MADAASTGSLVVAALAGGVGVVVGNVVAQATQLRRDRKQYEREDARHERERQEALEDERTKRREDRYVALLSELNRLHRALRLYADVVQEYVKQRDELEADPNEERREFLTTFAANSAEMAERFYASIGDIRREVSTAFYAAYGVASERVREVGEALADGRLWSLGHEMLTSSGRRLVMSDPDRPRIGTHAEHGAALVSDVESFRQLVEALDRLLREELRLD